MCAGAQWMQFELHAFDLQVLFVLRHHLCGQMLGRRRAAAACGQRFLLFFLVVFVRDDLMPAGNDARPFTWSPSLCVRITAVTGFGVIFAMSSSSSLPPAARGLGVDHDHAFVADNDAAVSAAAFDPVNVGLQLMDHERRRAGLAPPREQPRPQPPRW